MSFNERTHLFRVKYDEHMHEDIDWQELEPIIIHDKELGDGWELHNKTRAELEADVRSRHPHEFFIGRKIRKYFTVKEGRGKHATARKYPFIGTVDHYDRKLGLFRIKYDDGTSECVTLLDLEEILIIQDDGKPRNHSHVGKTRQEINGILNESVLWAEIACEASDGLNDFHTTVSTVGGDLADTITSEYSNLNMSRASKVSFSDEATCASVDSESMTSQSIVI